MCDIETLGTGAYSVITQIGACYFDRDTAEIGEKLLVNIQIQDCLNHGLNVDGGAIKFWLEQPGRSFLDNPVSLTKALQLLRDFYKKNSLVWAHSTFDFPRLAEVCQRTNQGMIFPYRNLRDIRTLVDISKLSYNKKEPGDPKNHNALDDCKYQVKYCCEAFNLLTSRNKYEVRYL